MRGESVRVSWHLLSFGSRSNPFDDTQGSRLPTAIDKLQHRQASKELAVHYRSSCVSERGLRLCSSTLTFTASGCSRGEKENEKKFAKKSGHPESSGYEFGGIKCYVATPPFFWRIFCGGQESTQHRDHRSFCRVDSVEGFSRATASRPVYCRAAAVLVGGSTSELWILNGLSRF